jgi:DNA primase RepB-like protein
MAVDIDREAAVDFLRTGYDQEDWIAVFVKSYATARVAQRVAPVSVVMSARVLDWLARENSHLASVYVSVNAVRPGQVTRTRRAISAIRHIFVDADRDGDEVIRTIESRRDLPRPSYVLHSSPDRVHVFWRVSGFTVSSAERLQKWLARGLGTDSAATAASQMTRLPGFVNHKYTNRPLITVNYRCRDGVCEPADFPAVEGADGRREVSAASHTPWAAGAVRRAEKYLAAVPPAIACQHGDARTFRVCCRLVRGFALSDAEALGALSAWNSRCEPPWSQRELIRKLASARRYGREPVGGLLPEPSMSSRRVFT